MPSIGLVTILYKSDHVLEGFINSLSKQSFQNYILYIIDNSPSDKTDVLLQKLFSNTTSKITYQHIRCSANIGVAEGNNLGIKAAIQDKCPYILLLNNDIEVEQNHLFQKLIDIAQQKSEQIIVPKILYYDTRKIWLAGGYYSKLRALGVHEGINKKDTDIYNQSKYITYAPTCFMFINTHVFNKIGIMDGKYFAYLDDTDFVYRAIKNNIKIWYESSLTILHKVSSSTGGDNSDFYIYYSNRNKIYFINKHYKGLLKYISLTYFLITRFIFYIKFNSPKRKKLIQGITDGFKLK